MKKLLILSIGFMFTAIAAQSMEQKVTFAADHDVGIEKATIQITDLTAEVKEYALVKKINDRAIEAPAGPMVQIFEKPLWPSVLDGSTQKRPDWEKNWRIRALGKIYLDNQVNVGSSGGLPL